MPLPLLPLVLALPIPEPAPGCVPWPDDSALLRASGERADGQAHLARLRAHLVPPRHRSGVELATEEMRPFHAPRPDMVREDKRSEFVRVFDAGFGWHFDLSPEEGSEEVVRFSGELIDGLEGPLDAGRHLTRGIMVRAPFPAALVDFVADHGQVTGFHDLGDGRAEVLLDLAGGRVLLSTVREEEGRASLAPGISGVDWLVHDDVFGDTLMRLRYAEGDEAAPGVVGGFTVQGPRSAGLDCRVTRVVLDTGTKRPARPPAWSGPVDPGQQEAELRVERRWLTDGVLEVTIPLHASRVLALALPEGWAVMEAPVSSMVGRKVLDVLAEERPGLAVAWALASHHHPHYVGGLRPLVAAGARVVVPEGVAGYVEELLSRPRTLRPDRLAVADIVPEVVGVPSGERWSPSGAEERLVAIEAAGLSNHTEAFCIFVLPSAKLGFGGDLLWVSTKAEGPPRRSPRTLGLARILEEAPDIDEYLTSWPVAGPEVAEPRWRSSATVEELRRAAGLR